MFTGTYTAIVTPFRNDKIDEPALEPRPYIRIGLVLVSRQRGANSIDKHGQPALVLLDLLAGAP